MSRLFYALTLCLFVAACGSRDEVAPRNLDNACSILEQRSNFYPAFKRAERKWGIPVSVQMATIYQESKFISNARPPKKRKFFGLLPAGRVSSAYGYSQALDGTWEEYQRDQRRYGARRNNIYDAADFMGWYMDKSTRVLGISKSDARNQYLAYHEGRGGFSRGTYRAKSWLIRVAGEVSTRAQMYSRQLASCGRI